MQQICMYLCNASTRSTGVHVYLRILQCEMVAVLQVFDWGLANATLEEVFIKIAKSAGAQTEELS